MRLIKPRGIYQYLNETNTHQITYYLDTRIFVLAGDSLEALLSLSEAFWSPRSDMTVTQYNTAYIASQDDTQVIELDKVS